MREFRFAGESARAKTLRAAKEAVEASIQKKLEGDYSPMVFRLRDYLCILWRDPHCGWTYRIVDLANLGVSGKRLEPVVTYECSREACERNARKHFAQYLFGREINGEIAILDDKDRRDFMSWVAVQRKIATRRAALQARLTIDTPPPHPHRGRTGGRSRVERTAPRSQ